MSFVSCRDPVSGPGECWVLYRHYGQNRHYLHPTDTWVCGIYEFQGRCAESVGFVCSSSSGSFCWDLGGGIFGVLFGCDVVGGDWAGVGEFPAWQARGL